MDHNSMKLRELQTLAKQYDGEIYELDTDNGQLKLLI